ncbi:MAG: radical SAM protein [Clostridiales bacterium]
MEFTIWLTRDCNLNCKYCYVKKENYYMNYKTADKIIDFIKKKSFLLNMETIKVTFHGGEPLLNYKLIKYFVNRIKKIDFLNKKLRFLMATNGLLVSDEIIDFLKENFKYSLTLSIDGKKNTHDEQRKFKNGEGSFENVLKTIEKLNASKIYFRYRMTVTSGNVKDLYENYEYLYKIGGRSIAFIPDYTDENWDIDTINLYYKNFKEIVDFLMKNDNKLAVILLQNLRKAYFRKRSFCSGGRNSFNIDCDGSIYPCVAVTGQNEYIIGHVESGISNEKLAKLNLLTKIKNNNCNECKMFTRCEGSVCKLLNKQLTGDYNIPSSIMCNMNNVRLKILKDFKVI